MSGLTYTDIFCGAGGSSIGLTEAGLELRLAANHWLRAIETHSANFPAAEHVCADISNYDMRRLPRTDVLWASVICTEGSPAGGKRKKRGGDGGQRSLIEEAGHVAAAGWERTRATAYDVIRATEVHGYGVVIVENVMEFATDWPLFDWWLDGMLKLGYRHRIVCVNSAHVGGEDNPFAPQWRDRIYIVFVREAIRMPGLEPRPLAWCSSCGEAVAARQSWKAHTPLGRRRIGKYREQYAYTCPNTTRRHESFTVEPFVLPAAAAIDWADLGTRIGDRKRTPRKPEGLAPSTITRIRAGLALFAESAIVRTNGQDPAGSAYLRARPVSGAPFGTVTTTRDEGLATPPVLILPVGGNNHAARPTTTGEPMRTRMARDTDALVTPPFILMSPDTARDRHALVVPYRRSRPSTTAVPLHTMATRDSAALVQPDALDIADCRFRMLKPREHLRAQRFPDSYVVTGNQGEQTMQAGNAVSANVAHWLGQALTAVL